jgi:hypothetical protein
MTKLTIVWTDGDSETVEAIRWHKKDDYMWISLGTALMLVPLINVKKIIEERDQPKRYSADGTAESRNNIDCSGTGDWYPSTVITICGL